MTGAAGIALRAYNPSDRALLDRWLRSDALSGWWGSRASAEARIRIAQESRAAICCVISVGGEAAGYAQAFEEAGGGDRTAGIPAGAWDCDVLLGSEAYSARGTGETALRLLTREVFETTLATACAIVVPVRNERAVRACERAGFKWVAVLQDAFAGPAWVMSLDRSRR